MQLFEARLTRQVKDMQERTSMLLCTVRDITDEMHRLRDFGKEVSQEIRDGRDALVELVAQRIHEATLMADDVGEKLLGEKKSDMLCACTTSLDVLRQASGLLHLSYADCG